MNTLQTRPSATGPATHAPALARDAARDLVVAAALLLATALGLTQAAGFTAGFAAKVMGVYAAGALLLWRVLRLSHPHPRFGAANRVTLGRFAMTALFAGLIGEPEARGAAPAWALVVAATLTAVLDAADGALARRSGLASRFGARFDMETDAWLMLVLCALLMQFDKVGAWVLAIGLMRYAFVAAAWVWPWLAAPLPPSRRRQAVCVFQIITLIVCLGPIVPAPLAGALATAALAALGLSFATDLRHLALTRSP